MIACYNRELSRYRNSRLRKTDRTALRNFLNQDTTKISWDYSLEDSFIKEKKGSYSADNIRTALYRPFIKKRHYFDRQFNGSCVYRTSPEILSYF